MSGTKADFEEIKCRIVPKLAGWKARILLAAIKVVFIKSNLTGISQHIMNWSKIPKI